MSNKCKTKYKIGNTVKVLGTSCGFLNKTIGMQGVVISVNKEDKDCFVKFKEPIAGMIAWFYKWDGMEGIIHDTLGRRNGSMDAS